MLPLKVTCVVLGPGANGEVPFVVESMKMLLVTLTLLISTGPSMKGCSARTSSTCVAVLSHVLWTIEGMFGLVKIKSKVAKWFPLAKTPNTALTFASAGGRPGTRVVGAVSSVNRKLLF